MSGSDSGPKVENKVDGENENPFEELSTNNLQDSTKFEMSSGSLPGGAKKTAPSPDPSSDAELIKQRSVRAPQLGGSDFEVEHQQSLEDSRAEGNRSSQKVTKRKKGLIDFSGETILDKLMNFIASLLEYFDSAVSNKAEAQGPDLPPLQQAKRKSSAGEEEEEEEDDPFGVSSEQRSKIEKPINPEERFYVEEDN